MPTRIILALMLSLLVLPAFAQDDIDQLRLKAEQGDAKAQLDLGFIYFLGQGVPQDVKEAVRWTKLAADQGDAFAQHSLGIFYETGDGVPQDDKEAVRWYRLAADQGLLLAQYALALMYDTGRGVPQNDEEAVRWFRLAADQGDAKAQVNLGFAYDRGDGVLQDDQEAVRWYRLAADQGLVQAQYNLGVMYANGRGVPQDDQEAVRWYRLAAEQGLANAQYNLGVMYANGLGVPQDDKEAVRWYRAAAEQGLANAQYNLGVMYDRGDGVLQDDQEAVRLYRLAADQGDAHAQYGLGFMYQDGQGVPQDYIQAHMWYNLAASNGVDGAAKPRDQLAAMMSYGDLSEAQRLAREWKPGSSDYAEALVPDIEPPDQDTDWKGNGSGIVLSTSGIIATNYHVIEGAEDIAVELMRDGIRMSYSAEVRNFDEQNDLALIQIVDPDYQPFESLPYRFETNLADVGTSVFTLGFPWALAGMGEEVKFTEGTISSRTGFQGAITEYQISVPVQPGNSGGPLFDDEGNLVALINAKITAAENVAYAIKASYLKSLVDVLGVPIQLPQDSSLSGIPLTEQIKILSEYVAIILVR